MNPNLLLLIQTLLATAEEIVPIFIHNPASQKVEGVIVSTVNGVLAGLGKPAVPGAAAPAPAAVPEAVAPPQ